ncbi:Uu.00g054220.m01.CDS01 [Anthostomella pinea]|uniref:Uu.00g054220.m01.CDS01 n=1 Tax=Anthostomella pinea TaxID=933095 RepID=A0AAI8YM77_9PEZI|nr:Uu.00g054220.m01.CDS01 [Anthostomella pinea]
MRVKIGIWAGGASGNDEGTIEWAGGETDFGAGPFTMYVKRIVVTNYNPGSTYTYGDMTGDYASIEIDSKDAMVTTNSTTSSQSISDSSSISNATANSTSSNSSDSSSGSTDKHSAASALMALSGNVVFATGVVALLFSLA